MNSDQLASVIRSLLKVVAGLLAAHGLQDTATLLNTPDVISAALLITSLAWSHLSHSAKDSANPPPPFGGKAALLLALALPSLLCFGCASLAPGARAVVVRAEQSITIANATFDSAVKIDNANRSFFRTNAPAFHQFCEWLRTPVVMPPLTNAEPRGLAIVQSADAVKNEYKATSSTNAYDQLIAALATVETATSEAQKLLATTQTLKP